MGFGERKSFQVSDTKLESQWRICGWGDSEECENCGDVLSPGYPARTYRCGEYCSRCGAKMKNPHYHTIEVDWGDCL